MTVVPAPGQAPRGPPPPVGKTPELRAGRGQNGPMALDIRAYDPSIDLPAVDRIWREVGWLEKGDEMATLGTFLTGSNAEVGLLDGAPECAVVWTPGTLRYQDTDLPLCAVTAVTTSRIGRKQGFATAMTARAVRDGAQAGAAVAALGIFDQGFYDRVGFGTGPYENRVNVDPASLAVDHVPYRRPVRLGPDDHAELHRALTVRHRGHGAVVLDPPPIIEAECRWLEEPFGLGFRDGDDGRLTHFLFGSSKGEHGPYQIGFLSYEHPAQLLELLRVVRELGDQVTSLRLIEPPELQLQDLIDAPFRRHTQTKASDHATGIEAKASFQYRIVDLAACVGARHWTGPPVRCNLTLSDPAVAVLARNDEHDWPGVAGEWVLTIGSTSTVEAGHDPGLETITASINGFTRAWLGARPPSSLTLTGELNGPPALLADLDAALAVPPPHPGWNF